MSARAEPGARAAVSEPAEGLWEKPEALLAQDGLHQPLLAQYWCNRVFLTGFSFSPAR